MIAEAVAAKVKALEDELTADVREGRRPADFDIRLAVSTYEAAVWSEIARQLNGVPTDDD